MELPLVYEKGESRPMYFLSDASGTKLEIAMELVNVYGKTVNYTATTTIKPKQWAKLTVRTDEKGLNGIAIDVTLNDETKETIYVNIGIPDFMEKLKGAPYIACDLFKWEDTNVSMEEPTEYAKDTKAAKVVITSGGKINQVLLTIKDGSSTLINQYDLANLTEDQIKDLADNYGFSAPEKMKGEMQAEFDLKSVIASLLGYLKYNKHPAQIFMGDTGSLALGGLLAGVAMILKQEVLLILIGGVFVAEVLSVMIQVSYYKRTHKRIFRMAPLHHHFEKGGWSEEKVVSRFWLVGVILAILGTWIGVM